jgi:hypothetical protein
MGELPPQDGGETLGGVLDWQTDPMTNLDSYARQARQVLPEVEPMFIHFGIKDFEPAQELKALSNLITMLAARLRSGEVLYIHCFGGKGRAGLVCACLLAYIYGLSADEALERIQAYCSLRNLDHAFVKSPETEPQKQQVREFVALMNTPLTRLAQGSANIMWQPRTLLGLLWGAGIFAYLCAH